jgi:CYTH domain-containing protein
MALEIERKFLLKGFTPLPSYKKIGIKQWYLTKPDDSLSNRIRLQSDGKCIFTIKKGASISLEELEWEVNFDDFKELIRWRPFVVKDRYTVFEDDEVIITVDEYKEQLDGLYIMEVEGKGDDSFNIINNYKLSNEFQEWVDREVSSDSEYKNFSLAEKNMIKPKNIKKLYEIIDDVVRKDARDEAKEIADHMDDKDASDIEMYYNDDSGSIVCLHLDDVKHRLIKNGILSKKDNDQFGDVPY